MRRALTRAAGENVGSYNITAGTFTAPSANYSAPSFTGTPTLTINTAALTASVANQTKTYGADDPGAADRGDEPHGAGEPHGRDLERQRCGG